MQAHHKAHADREDAQDKDKDKGVAAVLQLPQRTQHNTYLSDSRIFPQLPTNIDAVDTASPLRTPEVPRAFEKPCDEIDSQQQESGS